MRITLLLDNLNSDGLAAEHGLSFLVESDSRTVVFDVGQTDVWLKNLQKLRPHLPRVDAVAISHGHYDHTGGLSAAVCQWPEAKLHAHPACFDRKCARSEQGLRYIGVQPDVAALQEEFGMNRGPLEVSPGVTLSGEVELRADGDVLQKRFVVVKDSGEQQDRFDDEQCMAVQGSSGVAVLVGCSHRGVENNLLSGMEAVSADRVKLLAGGFHLGDASPERLDEAADSLAGAYVETIVCCHCTGMNAYEALRDRLGDRVILGRSGMIWDI